MLILLDRPKKISNGFYIGKQQEFLDFVLEQYVKSGVGELDRSKLPQLLELKYHDLRDAVAELGSVGTIGEVFIGFQEYLYARDRAAWEILISAIRCSANP